MANINPFWKTEEEQEIDVLDDLGCELIVWNDDVNTFDWVILSLMEICGHTEQQAEQCSLLIHYKGKCVVKKGNFEEMNTMKDALHDRGISAEVKS